MSGILAEHADFMFDAVQGYISGLSEEELNWKPIEESLSIHSILVHTTRIALILIPQVIDGTTTTRKNLTHTRSYLRTLVKQGRRLSMGSGI